MKKSQEFYSNQDAIMRHSTSNTLSSTLAQHSVLAAKMKSATKVTDLIKYKYCKHDIIWRMALDLCLIVYLVFLPTNPLVFVTR